MIHCVIWDIQIVRGYDSKRETRVLKKRFLSGFLHFRLAVFVIVWFYVMFIACLWKVFGLRRVFFRLVSFHPFWSCYYQPFSVYGTFPYSSSHCGNMTGFPLRYVPAVHSRSIGLSSEVRLFFFLRAWKSPCVGMCSPFSVPSSLSYP